MTPPPLPRGECIIEMLEQNPGLKRLSVFAPGSSQYFHLEKLAPKMGSLESLEICRAVVEDVPSFRTAPVWRTLKSLTLHDADSIQSVARNGQDLMENLTELRMRSISGNLRHYSGDQNAVWVLLAGLKLEKLDMSGFHPDLIRPAVETIGGRLAEFKFHGISLLPYGRIKENRSLFHCRRTFNHGPEDFNVCSVDTSKSHNAYHEFLSPTERASHAELNAQNVHLGDNSYTSHTEAILATLHLSQMHYPTLRDLGFDIERQHMITILDQKLGFIQQWEDIEVRNSDLGADFKFLDAMCGFPRLQDVSLHIQTRQDERDWPIEKTHLVATFKYLATRIPLRRLNVSRARGLLNVRMWEMGPGRVAMEYLDYSTDERVIEFWDIQFLWPTVTERKSLRRTNWSPRVEWNDQNKWASEHTIPA
jgi:hypothetical protein